MTTNLIVSVFGSSSPREGSEQYSTAFELGKVLAEADYTICNGGYGGTMEATARGAKAAGGKTIGVVMESFSTEANPYVDEKIVMKTLIERLLKLVEMGNAYVVLPGGTGTLLELAAVWEMMNKELLTRKPIITVGTFWSRVVETMREELQSENRKEASELVVIASTPRECVEMLNRFLR